MEDLLPVDEWNNQRGELSKNLSNQPSLPYVPMTVEKPQNRWPKIRKISRAETCV
jgi:hypothetical protein